MRFWRALGKTRVQKVPTKIEKSVLVGTPAVSVWEREGRVRDMLKGDYENSDPDSFERVLVGAAFFIVMHTIHKIDVIRLVLKPEWRDFLSEWHLFSICRKSIIDVDDRKQLLGDGKRKETMEE